VTIGVYEAQEHHSAIGWFTCCAACFIAAILIPIMAFVYFPWIEHLGSKQTKTSEARLPVNGNEEKAVAKVSQAPITTQPSTLTLPDGRSVINVTPRFLAETYRSFKTDIEAQAALQRYLGKLMKVNGIIGNIYFGGGPNGKNTLFIRLEEERPKEKKAGSLDATLRSLDGVNATLIFTNKSLIDRLITFNHGDRVSAIGRLEDIDRSSIKLEHCELTE
jgi:hypothetical protein